MSLHEKLEAVAGESRKKFPGDALQVLMKFREELKEQGLKDKIPGEKELLPSFDLEDEEGRSISSEDFLASGPMVLTFFRGRW